MSPKLSRTSPTKSNENSRRERERAKARTRELLETEIGFIPNPTFREMDADRAWRLGMLDSACDTTSVPAGTGVAQMPAHLERMCAAPLLSPTEERELFRRMNYLKYRANGLRPALNANRPNVRKLEEIEELLTRAAQIRNRIVSSNTRLVISIVKKFVDEKNSFDTLLSEGVGCLLKAVEKFDFDRGFRFSTYATMAVKREVFRLIQRDHRDRSRFATGNSEVLDEQMQCEERPERSESALLQLNSRVSEMLTHLDERERYIVKARYGFVDLGMKPTFSKLGEKLGVSKERVRQIELRAMNKLRDLADELRLADLASLA